MEGKSEIVLIGKWPATACRKVWPAAGYTNCSVHHTDISIISALQLMGKKLIFLEKAKCRASTCPQPSFPPRPMAPTVKSAQRGHVAVTVHLPARASCRKRAVKSLDPDFVTDYLPRRRTPRQVPVEKTTPPPHPIHPDKKKAKRLDSLLKRDRSMHSKVAQSPKPSRVKAETRPLDACRSNSSIVRPTDGLFPCMKYRSCAICGNMKTRSDTYLMCSTCNNVYHRDCYLLFDMDIESGGSLRKSAKMPMGSDWICGRCPRPERRSRRGISSAQNVTLNNISPFPAGNESSLLQIPKLSSEDEMPEALPISTCFMPALRRQRQSRKSPPHLYSDASDLMLGMTAFTSCDERTTEAPASERVPQSVSQKLAMAISRIRGISHVSTKPVPTKKEERMIQKEEEANSELRQDMALWSVEQCAAFFRESYPQLSHLITDHELQGSALVVISRAQFLDLFHLPVGVALKMHAAVCRCRRIFF